MSSVTHQPPNVKTGTYNLQDGRTERALILLRSAVITPAFRPGVTIVSSQSAANRRYTVSTALAANRSCECQDWANRAPIPCKHIIAAEVYLALADLRSQLTQGVDPETIYDDLMAQATGDAPNTHAAMLDAYLVAIVEITSPPVIWQDMHGIVRAAERLSGVGYEIYQYRRNQFAYIVRPRPPFRARYPWFMVYGSYQRCYVANDTWKWASASPGDHIQRLADAAEVAAYEQRQDYRDLGF